MMRNSFLFFALGELVRVYTASGEMLPLPSLTREYHPGPNDSNGSKHFAVTTAHFDRLEI